MMAKDAKCEYKPSEVQWKCKLEGDSSALRDNMKTHCGILEPGKPTTVAGLSSISWPSQAHHLIPHQQLKPHPVASWLTKSPASGEARLYHDNHYSVDHGLNGKFMPYSSALSEWSSADATTRKQLSEQVMEAAGMQLHQGPHSTKGYGVGEVGYKTRVKQYLDRIHLSSVSHYADPACDDCKGKQQDGKYPARRNVVRFVDRASGLLEVDINRGHIFVSKRAATYANQGGIMY
ncbi:MAG: AHH domain-containing protein [Deltaproteobacteria bacterium]|nr:AHH domain-containing protein [Deltaproteobacteria bacterium]